MVSAVGKLLAKSGRQRKEKPQKQPQNELVTTNLSRLKTPALVLRQHSVTTPHKTTKTSIYHYNTAKLINQSNYIGCLDLNHTP